MGCGYVSREAPAPTDLPIELGDVSECPGRLILLPDVQETARAAYWAETGQLELYYERAPIPRNVFEYIECLEGSKRSLESEVMREQTREMRKKGAQHGPR